MIIQIDLKSISLYNLILMKSTNYISRICDKLLRSLLESMGAVLVEGAKWCGKTQSSLQIANSVVYMQDPDEGPGYLAMADTKPSLLLEGEPPLLLDEWQMAPVLWDAVRFAVDKRGLMGQFILTGSSTPSDNQTAHSGTGRIARMLLRPMSLFESNESNGKVSLKDLFDGKTDIGARSSLTIEQIAHAICRGGWPAAVISKKQSPRIAMNYVDAIVNLDVQRVDGVEKDPERVRVLLQSLSRNISTMATAKTIMDDMRVNEASITDKTLSSYLNALRRLFVIEDIPAWQPSLRSKTAIRTTHKRQFVDPSIATSAMRTNAQGILRDFETFGFLFESLCTRDLRVYAQANDGEIFHYRDKSGLESDMVIKLHDGRWAAVEVKLGMKQIDEAAANLLKLSKKVNIEKMNQPSFLMVVTGGQVAYRRPDGVMVVPIGCLRD
jgi:predicted AAA+ superfamily ATPase